jgi:hypothetical protein
MPTVTSRPRKPNRRRAACPPLSPLAAAEAAARAAVAAAFRARGLTPEDGRLMFPGLAAAAEPTR